MGSTQTKIEFTKQKRKERAPPQKKKTKQKNKEKFLTAVGPDPADGRRFRGTTRQPMGVQQMRTAPRYRFLTPSIE